MCKCVCVHLSVCVSMYVQMHMYVSRGHLGLYLNSAHLAFLRRFFIGLGFTQLCRLVHEPRNPCLCPPALRLQAYTKTSSFLDMGSGDQIQVLMLSTLPTEAPPQSPPFSSISNLPTPRPYLRSVKACGGLRRLCDPGSSLPCRGMA